jgi:hypothetical protein
MERCAPAGNARLAGRPNKGSRVNVRMRRINRAARRYHVARLGSLDLNKEPRNVTKTERIDYLCRVYEMLRNGSISHADYNTLVALIMEGYVA